MTTEYHPFYPNRPVAQYAGQAGPHNGQALDATAFAALADAKMSGGVCEIVVRGQWVRDDGVTYLDFGVDPVWVELHSHYRRVDGRLRWVCPTCGQMSGKHSKTCDFE